MNRQCAWSESLDGATVLVTGGAGLVGSRICRDLRAAGARPLVLCSRDAYPAEVYRDLFDVRSEEVETGDIRDAALVRGLVARSDAVVHAAALADVAACTRRPQDAIDVNIAGTQAVLDAVAACDRPRRLVFVSSASVYGHGEISPAHRTTAELLREVHGRSAPAFHEDMPLKPTSAYGNTKAWGEQQTRLQLDEAARSWSVVRYFSVYGQPQVIKPGSHSWVVAWFAAHASCGMPLHLNGGGQQVRDFVHVDDIAQGTLRALSVPGAHRQVINIGTGRATTIRRIAELVMQFYPGTTLTEAPLPVGDPMGGYASTHRMTSTLAWQPSVTVEDGVRHYVQWLQAHPQAVPNWLRTDTGYACI
ncbi:NAD-dependent epimerase/dehydratase family protein [Streptomyces sp. NPDC050703]|uniref:NAD-dependent epimerase/dehydratase family protein n=1 Tax=Streptomyces sp. NPDC050703 TaxID=3157218 RepID=UPI0034139FE4